MAGLEPAKKRICLSGFFAVLALLMITIVVSQYVQADDECDCAYAEICGVKYVCGDPKDRVCPEDFADLDGNTPDCSINPPLNPESCTCTDPQCTICDSTIEGIVRNEDGQPIEGAVVTSHPTGMPENSAVTGGGGKYSLKTIGGYYTISVQAIGYDTWVELVGVNCGDNEKDFSVLSGACHADCTDWEGRCNPACDGAYFPDDEGGGEECRFFAGDDRGETAKSVCDGRLKGTLVQYDESQSIICCDGTPFSSETKPASVSGSIKNLVRRTLITRYHDMPVKLVLLVWKNT